MALFLQHTTVYHPGRTAGHWVRKSLALRNLIVGDTGSLHDSPTQIWHLQEVDARPHSLSIVRHPAMWLRSLWIHETNHGWTMDSHAPSNRFGSFAEYLEEIVARYPAGAATEYFSAFVDLVSENLRTEALAEDLWSTLGQFGENIATETSSPKPINQSVNDFVTRSATAPRSLWEHFLHTERDFCKRFNYSYLPQSLIADGEDVRTRWFPQFSAPGNQLKATRGTGDTAPEECPETGAAPNPDHLFLFNSQTNDFWQGKPTNWRRQLAFIDAIQERAGRNKRGQTPGTFLELGCGDGYFVYLAEHLGYGDPTGIDYVRRATSEFAQQRLQSGARFIAGVPLLTAATSKFDTVLIRDLMNEFPWPHLVLRQAGKWLAEGGELTLGAITLSIDSTERMTLGLDPGQYGLPPTCARIPTDADLSAIIRQSGFTISHRYGAYDQFFFEDHPLARIGGRVSPRTPWSLQTIILGLVKSEGLKGEMEAVSRSWFRNVPDVELDLSAADIGEIPTRTIRQLAKEAANLQQQVDVLTNTLRDRELTLSQERFNFEQHSRELEARTRRLEVANGVLCRLEAGIQEWRVAEALEP